MANGLRHDLIKAARYYGASAWLGDGDDVLGQHLAEMLFAQDHT
jgi:hypothetical protein